MGEGLVSFLKKEPPTPAARVLPPEGEDLGALNLPPLGEVARSAEGGLVSFSRFPREGGDPDPDMQTENGPLGSCLREDRGRKQGPHPTLSHRERAKTEKALAPFRGRGWGEGVIHPPLRTLPPKARLQRATIRRSEPFWIPACAGNAEERAGLDIDDDRPTITIVAFRVRLSLTGQNRKLKVRTSF